MTTSLAASVTESLSLEWRLSALTNGVGDLDLDLVRGLLGDLDMSLGGGVGGLGGRQMMCLNLDWDGAGVGGGWSGGGGGGEEDAEDALPS